MERRGRSGVYAGLTGASGAARPVTAPARTGGTRPAGRRRASPAGLDRGRSGGHSPGPPSGAALHSAELKCSFCGKGHEASRCRAFLRLNVQQRLQRLREVWGCFACLEVGHRACNCTKRCERCGGNHHRLLCLGGPQVASVASASGGVPHVVSGTNASGRGPQVGSAMSTSGGGPQVGGVSLSC